MRIFKFVIILVLTIKSLSVYCNPIQVSTFRLLEGDLTATTQGTTELDPNGEKAALIKVVTTQTGFQFDCGSLGIVKTVQHVGEIWVYVPRGVKKITIAHPILGVLRDYSFPTQIEGARTYEMVLTTGQVQTVVQQNTEGQYLILNFTPTTAIVKIDGIEIPSNNGIITKLLNYGEHTCEVTDPLYHGTKKDFVINNAKVYLNIDLQPAFGILNISSSPENGAKVYIDNSSEISGITPFKSPKLIEGIHNLRLQLNDYETNTQNVKVEGNGNIQNIVIPLSANFALVKVIAPNNSEIYINDEKKGTSQWEGRLIEGLYAVEARKKFHKSTIINVNIKKGENKELFLKDPIPIYGTLNITGNPIGASVYVDDDYLGTTPDIFPKVLIGSHKVIITKEGYVNHEEEINIQENKTTDLTYTLSNSISIKIECNQKSVKLKIDGIEYDINKKISVSKGIHIIDLSKDGFQTIHKNIDVSEKASSFDFNINRTPKEVTINANANFSIIYIDGIPYQAYTNVFKTVLPLGTHKISIVSPGYKPYNGKINVEGEGQNFYFIFSKSRSYKL